MGQFWTLLQWQIDWPILKAQNGSAASHARFSVRESPFLRGLQTTMRLFS
jgi:hypothetical protein